MDDGQRYIMYFDWAGMLGRDSSYGGQFGPESVTGKVTERPLGDGTSELTVSVHTKGALVWVTTWSEDGLGSEWLRRDGPTVFGHRETELLADPSLEAARADIHYTLKLIVEEGAPLRDELDYVIEDNAENGAYSTYPNDQFHLGPIGPRPK